MPGSSGRDGDRRRPGQLVEPLVRESLAWPVALAPCSLHVDSMCATVRKIALKNSKPDFCGAVIRYPQFAINTGSDGDLSQNWVVLDLVTHRISGPAKDHGRLPDGEGTGDAPTLRYDAVEGYFYSLGGG